MDTEVGHIRIRAKGGAGLHNGMKSLINELQTEDFSRIRVGIGRPHGDFDRINYVIGKLDETEIMKLKEGEEQLKQ